MTFTKTDQADLDFPRQELSNGGLKSVVTLLVCWQINFYVGSDADAQSSCRGSGLWRNNFMNMLRLFIHHQFDDACIGLSRFSHLLW